MADISAGTLISYSIWVNGNAISDSYQLSGLHIEQAIGRVASAKLTFLDGSPSEQTFPVSDSSSFGLGNTVSIALGYDGNNEAVFEGVVVSQTLRADAARSPVLEVLCKAAGMKLTVAREPASPVLRLTYGNDILTFSAQLDAVNEQARITGQLRFQGSAKLQPGNYLTLAGVGARFVGDHFVSAVLHEVGDGNWITETSIGPNPQRSSDRITSHIEPRAPLDEQENNVAVQPSGGDSVVRDEQREHPKTPVKEPTRIRVHNAGLVIMQSYLPMLFQRGQMIQDRKFVSEAAQLRAVQYLHYVCTGQTETPEQQAALNKLLCGVAADTPIETLFEPSQAEREDGKSMIEAVVSHWRSLGQQSVEGLRGNFLIRDGWLEEQEDRWVLKVERRAYDVLLARCPFTFSIIKYPWMPKALSVDWKY